MHRILIVDDCPEVRSAMRTMLGSHGFELSEADSARAAQLEFRTHPPDLVILDYDLPDGRAIDLMPMLKRIDARVPIVIFSELACIDRVASIDRAVLAIKHGAEHFVARPFHGATLLVIIERILESCRNRRRQIAICARNARHELDPFAGVSEAVGDLAEQAHRVLDSHAPVLIQGETGTGKGVLAAWLHGHGPRAEESFVDINCAGLSGELLESELFGHERGAYTGAVTAKLGLLEVAHRGTAFLDEIGEVGQQLQPRLLKVLEEKRFRRLGEVRERAVDVRIIAATNRDLTRLVRQGRFRSDLYFRINTIVLNIPPLRQRREDIPMLARHVAGEAAGGRPVEFTDDALRAMQSYSWPGNVRELRNVIERGLLLSRQADRLCAADLRFDVRDVFDGAHESTSTDEAADDRVLTLEEMERLHVERVVELERGAVDRAAARLGISRSTLYQKLKRYREAAG